MRWNRIEITTQGSLEKKLTIGHLFIATIARFFFESTFIYILEIDIVNLVGVSRLCGESEL